MKQLLIAKDLHDDIKDLMVQIEALQIYMNEAMTNKRAVKVSFKFEETYEENPIVEEDEEHYLHNPHEMRIMLNGQVFAPENEVPKGNIFLEDSEFIVMIGSIIKFKTEKKDKLIEEFNQLSLKLTL